MNPQVRSLDRQLASWNSNESVAAAATNLLAEARTQFAGDGTADSQSLRARLATLLRGHVPQPVPTVAAPGLSPHGQMRAVDFQVHRLDEIVAGPDTHTIDVVWEQGGWAGRLDAAVRAASHRFIGPLASPRAVALHLHAGSPGESMISGVPGVRARCPVDRPPHWATMRAIDCTCN